MSVKKYIYLVEDRDIWLKLAVQLKKENIAEPIICFLGEESLIEYSTIFKDCTFIDYSKSNLGILTEKVSYKTNGIDQILNQPDFLKFKEQTIKMMDRSDLFGGFRNMDRNDIFYSMLLYYFDLIQEKKPDFILMPGTPHLASSFVVYNLCKYLKIDASSFYLCSILPIVFLREGINGKFLKSSINPLIEDSLGEILKQDIVKYTEKFYGEKFESPAYMISQKKGDEFSFSNFFKNLKKTVSLVFFNKVEYFGFSGYSSSIGFLEKILFFILKNKLITKNISSLKKYQFKGDLSMNNDYVYFPLHYEIERATLPNGGDYYDQIKAIISLRKVVPMHIPIYVKEHYSQFTSALQGYRGKGRFFYEAISKIENVYIIDMNIESATLIKNSLFVASITGTVLLESICFSKPSVILGNSWFENFTGITRFSYNLTLDEVLSNIGSISSFKEDIEKLIGNYGAFGVIGKISEIYYQGYFDFQNAKNIELLGISNLIKLTLR